MDSGSRITTFSINNSEIITAATEVKSFSGPISSATSAPGISPSKSYVLRMNTIAQTWCAKNVVLGRPEIEFFWPAAQSSVDWRIGWVFSCLTASSKDFCSNSLMIVQQTGFNTALVFARSRISSPFATSWELSLGPVLVFLSFSMILFSWLWC